MGSATKWLFSASVSLAFVAGCLSVQAEERPGKTVYFSESDETVGVGYKEVWAHRGYYEGDGLKSFDPVWGSGMPGGVHNDLVIKILSSEDQDFNKFGDIKSFWKPVTTPRNNGQTSKLDLDLFKKNGYVPTVQLLGEWKDFSVGNKDLEVRLQGQVNQNTSIFSGTDVSTLSFEEVSFVCEGLSDCDQWRKSNPNGVRLEFDAPFGSTSSFYIYANNPYAVPEIDGSCFQEEGSGVKVPTNEKCVTDVVKESGTYTSLKIEDNGTLSLGGNLILDEGFTSFEVQNNARVEGSGGLVKTGDQTTVLEGNGTFAYDGGVYVQEGVLEITNATGLGSTSTKSGTYVEEGAILRISVSGEKSPPGSTENEVKIFEKISLSAGELDLNGDYVDLRNGIVLQGGQNSTIHVNNKSKNVFVRSTISGEGGLIKTGQGFLRLGSSEPQQYQGETIIKEGELRIADTTKLPESTDVLIEKEGRLRLQGEGNKIQSLNGSGTLELFLSKSILTSGLSGKDDEFSGVISGDGGFTKVGIGTSTFSGEKNTYTGATIVQSGVLDIQNPTALGSVSGETSIEAGASMQLSLTGTKNSNGIYQEIAFNEPLVINSGKIIFPGNKTPKGDSSDDLGSRIGLKGPIQIFERATFETSILQTRDDGNRQAMVSATVSGEGDFQKTGEGSLLLRDADFRGFTGNFFVTEGLLALGQDYVIPAVSNVAISGGAKVTMYSQTMNQSIASLTGEGVWVMFYTGQESTIGNDNGENSLNQFDGRITGSGSLVKDRTNTLELSGSNTYTGSTTVESGTLRVTGTLSDSTAVTVASGATYDVESTDTIGSIAGAGTIQIATGKTLSAGGLNTDTEVSGVISGDGGFTKVGTGTTTFSGENTYIGPTTVSQGTLRASADNALASGDITVQNQATLDLGGKNQGNPNSIVLERGELKNGSIGSTTVRSTAGGIVRDISGIDSDYAVLKAQGSGVLEIAGVNEFQTLALDSNRGSGGSVRINSGATLELKAANGKAVLGSGLSDYLEIQGSLVVPKEVNFDLGAGNDLMVVAAGGSIDVADSSGQALTLDGGAGTDVFFDGSGQHLKLVSSVDLLNEPSSTDGQNLVVESLDESIKIQNFPVVGVAGQGVVYFGEKPSFAVDQAEGAPPEGEYGLMLARSLSSPQILTINAGGSAASETTAGAIALYSGSGSKLELGEGSLDAQLIYGNPESAINNSIELGAPIESFARGEQPTFASGTLDVGKLYGFQSINQKGGLWSYSGDMGDADLKALGLVRVKAGEVASFASIEAQERDGADPERPVQGRAAIAVSGTLNIAKGIRENGESRASLLVANETGSYQQPRVNLSGESVYSGPTIVTRGATLNALNTGALSPVSKTFIGREASIDITGAQDIYRLVIRDQGSMTGDSGSSVVSQSIVNRGDINLDSIQMEDGMTRFLDRVIERRGVQIPVDSPLRKIKAQGSLKNLGGSIDLTGDLTFESTGDAGHALLNLTSREEEKFASIRANSIELSDANDVLINTGVVETFGSQGIDFKGGNDLVLTKGTFDIADGSLIDGGEPLDTSRWRPEGDRREITGLNIFKAYSDPGVQSSDLVNWAAIKMDVDGDWEFPQGGECRVTGVGNSYSVDTLCVGLTGQKEDQFVRIDSGATLDAGVISLRRDSSNSIEVRNGNLHAILIEGAPGQTKGARNDRVVLGDGEGGSGELIVGAITGVDSIEQDGGTWAYGVKGADDPNVPSALIDSGRRSEEDLDEMGLFPALSGYGTASVASVEIAGRDGTTTELQRAAFSSITGDQDQPLRVVNDGAELVVVEGIHGNASLASSGESHLSGKSSYTGPTIVVSGGTLTAANTDALSPVSTTLIGREASIDITGAQDIYRLVIRDQGSMESTDSGSASSLASKSIINLGDINLDSIQMEDGMTRFLDRVIERRGVQIPVDSPLRKIKAQGSLKNLGGSIDLTGDLTFESTGDAGHALLNLTSREEEKFASIRANSIELSDANDVLINTGVVETFGSQGIDFKGGNDLVLTKGTFDIADGSLIDGGEPLDTSRWRPEGDRREITGLNIFKAYSDPGVQSSDLVNWAAIKMDVDGDWEFPQGGECRVTGVGNSYSVDTLCVGLTGQKEDQFVRIDSGATLDAGVISLRRDSSNSIEVRNGNLHAILIEGAPGQTKGARNDRVVLGDGEGGSGELIVGAITGVDSIEQDGGTWAYGVKGADDPNVPSALIDSGRRSEEDLDEMGLFPALSGYGTASVASVEIAGRDGTTTELQRAAFSSITGDQDQPLRVVNDGAELVVVEGIHGNASLTTSGNTLLSGESSYTGDTQIKADGELKAGNDSALSPGSEITLDDGGVLNLDGYSNTIAGLLSGPKLQSNPGVVDLGEAGEATLSVGKGDFSGEIVGDGALRKFGQGTLILSGANAYTGSTTVEDGVLALATGFGIPQASSTLVNGSGRLDLASNLIGQGEFRIDQLSINEGGRLFVRASQPLVSKNIVLNANAADSANPGGIAVALNVDNEPPIQVLKKFNYRSGVLVVAGPATDDPEGTWKIIDGKVENAEDLAKNTVLTVSGFNKSSYAFGGLGEKNIVDGGALYQGYLEEGSLDLVIEQKSEKNLSCDLNPDQDDCKDEGTTKPPVIPPLELPTCEGDDCEVGGELPKPEPLPGCEEGDDLCDIISDIPGDEDDALGQEEDLAGDVIDGLLDGLAEEEIDLPLSFDYGQLAKLVTSGLLPRNVDAPGRSLFNYNNLLVDTVFERLPLRQFTAVEVAEVVEEEAVILEPDAVAPAEPIRGLWSQAEGMDEQQAQEYLAQRVAQGDQVVVEDVDFELDGIGYVEDPSLTGQYANRDGVRAWYKAFGGDTGPSKTSTLYGDYNASASGMVLGADVSLGSNVQIGVFGNYGDINLYQYSGDTGSGSWNPTGWGGGITADWWSKNFYVQGLISASSFSGNQKRNIIAINEQVGNETARGDKTVTSYSYALRLGAPFEAGRLLLEPQFTAAWTQNQESGFTENGADQLNLRYGSRTTNFLQTELGMKFALPIKSGERAEWVPNLRVAWLGDWNQNNEDQSIGYAFTDQTVGVDSLEENQNGVLIEGGLDYTMANINNGSWKLYVRGGAEVWGGERGTDWRASGGVTWQF